MKSILQSYLRRLTNLSGNSRSMLLLKLVSDQSIDIHDFDYSLNEPSFSIIENLISRKLKTPLCDIQNSRDESSNKLSARLKKLSRVEKLVFEERGARDLFVAWPFVRGKFSDGTVTRCPLMFFPVSLESDESKWYLKLRKDVNITLNKTFILAYAYFNNLKPDEELLERVFDDFDKESKGFRTDLYELIKNSNLELNFNQDNFKDALKAFESFKRIDLEKNEKDGELKLHPEAVLGIFPQAGSYLVPDYISMIEDPRLSDMESFFAERNLDEEVSEDSSYYRFLKKVREDQTFTPFKMDAYQENAIKAVKKGNSVVVQGPPGTGKSQLICNLIADFIARGKNVLLVSQKRAALDVVFERLKEKQLGDFIGLLHDFKNDRKPIYEQIESQIDRLEDYQSMNNGLDSIPHERKFLQTSRKIDQIEEELEEFKLALFDTSECGVSIKELYLSSNPEEEFVSLNQEYRSFNFQEIDSFLNQLKSYAAYAGIFLIENYQWRKRKSFAGYKISDLKALRSILKDIPLVKEQLEKGSEKALGKIVAFEDAVEFVGKTAEINRILELLKDERVYKAFVKLLEYKKNEVDLQWLSSNERNVMQCFKGVGPEESLETKELGRFQEALERTIDARKGLIKWVRWKLFSKDKIFITRVLVANQLKSNKKGFDILIEKIDNRLNLEHNVTKIRSHQGLISYPQSIKKIDHQNWFFYQKGAVEARLIYLDIRSLENYLSPKENERVQFLKQLSGLIDAFKILPDKLKHWEQYFTIQKLREMFSGQASIDLMDTVLTKDFDALCEFDSIYENLSIEEKRVVGKLIEKEPIPDVDGWMALFLNSLKLAWIEHIETKYPLLRSVSTRKFEDMQTEIQHAVKEKLKISNEILLMKARERVYKNVEYNRLNNMVTYRDVYHQVTKKRRIWPVRKLIAQFPREVFDLVPCWLASPESTSAIFPMEKIFDLVIFDEASQCFVEKGLPAIYRGKQVVVAGDDKQLKPNDLYKVRWEDENKEDIPELDFDSLLNLSNQYLMSVQLNEHYRSKSLDLIHFSNVNFYGNRLKLLPDRKEVNRDTPGISYIKVDGIWENNINKIEAEKIAELLKELVHSQPEKTIGVVTFNAKQQLFLMDFLDDYAVSNNFLLPESLIIKNIENVQGDEKDIIIFSIVYAPDSQGKLNMQFGSLNAEGGENRLNVAITRAKEKIYVVSSIEPQQLKVDETKNEGPQFLKRYLEYAMNVSDNKFVYESTEDGNFDANWYLKSKITSLQFDNSKEFSLDYSLPFVDVSIKKKNKYYAVLFTDDNLYFKNISVKDTHVYMPFTLSHKNWRFTGFFSREYWLNKDGVKERILKLLNS